MISKINTPFKHVKDKGDINQQDFKIAVVPNLNNFHSIEVVNRVSETQLHTSRIFN